MFGCKTFILIAHIPYYWWNLIWMYLTKACNNIICYTYLRWKVDFILLISVKTIYLKLINVLIFIQWMTSERPIDIFLNDHAFRIVSNNDSGILNKINAKEFAECIMVNSVFYNKTRGSRCKFKSCPCGMWGWVCA